MQSFHTFPNASAAREYRHVYGTGGFIFADDLTGSAILFPPNFAPFAIFHHALTKGRSGRLLAN